jgi:hypothetical protein
VSPVSKGRKPQRKRPRRRAVPSERSDELPPERWAALGERVELSGCLVQGEPDSDTVVLVAKVTGGGQSAGIEVVVIERGAETIEFHASARTAGALLRRIGVDLAEAPLSPDEFRRQVEAALIVRDDDDSWFAERVPGVPPKGPADYATRARQLRRWLGLPDYEPVPRLERAERPVPVVLPPPGPVTGFRISVGLAEPDPPIWRRLEVGSNVTLARLHRIIAVAFDRDEGEEHDFRTGYGEFGTGDVDRPDDQVTLAQVAPGPGHRLGYHVADWEHWIRVESVIAFPLVPRCVTGERAAPPDGCESSRDYETLLEALEEPEDEDNEDLLAEYGVRGGFDPEWFDAVFTSHRLARLS